MMDHSLSSYSSQNRFLSVLPFSCSKGSSDSERAVPIMILQQTKHLLEDLICIGVEVKVVSLSCSVTGGGRQGIFFIT